MVATHGDNTIRITNAASSDVPVIQYVLHSSWSSVYKDIFGEERASRYLKRSFSMEALTRAVTNSGAMYLVALYDGTIRGICHYGAPLLDDCEDRKSLYSLYVHPGYWQKGIGTALLAAMAKDLRSQRVTDVFAYVDPRNELACQFFKKRGFAHLPDDDRDGELYLRKVL